MIDLQTIPNESGIYKFTNTINNKCYIGQAQNLRNRFKEHLRKFQKNNKNSYFYSSIRKNGLENFELEILIQGKFTKLELNDLEIDFIRLYNSNNSNFGYNLTVGGDGLSGYVFTEEHKEKLRKASKGRKQSPESIEKTRRANLGRKHTKEQIEKRNKSRLKNGNYIVSEETRQKLRNKKHSEESKKKIGEANKDKIVSQETRDKIGKAHKGKIISEEQKQKLREANLGKKQSLETVEKRKLSNKGFKHSEESKEKMRGKIVSDETRKKLSKAKKGILLGRKQTPEHIKKSQQVKNFNKLIKVIQQNNFICYWLYFKCIEIYKII